MVPHLPKTDTEWGFFCENSILTDFDKRKKSSHGVLILAQRGGGGISQPSRKLALERCEWVSRPVWMERKISLQQGFEHRTV